MNNKDFIKYKIINKDELCVELFNDFIRHQIVANVGEKKIPNGQ